MQAGTGCMMSRHGRDAAVLHLLHPIHPGALDLPGSAEQSRGGQAQLLLLRQALSKRAASVALSRASF